MKKLFSMVITLMILTIFLNIIDFNSVISNIKNAKTNYFVFAILMSIFWPILGFFRWKCILYAFDYKPLDFYIIRSILISFSANLMMPGKGGDFSKAYTISTNQRSKFILPLIIERLGDVFVLVLISIVGSIYLNEINFLLSSSLILLLMIIVILSLPLLSKVKIFKTKFTILNNLIKNLHKITDIFKNKSNYIFFAMFFSFLNWLLASVQIWFFFKAYNVNIDLVSILMMFPIAILLSLIPITPGGIGVRESLFFVLFSKFASIETCIIVSLNYYFFSVALLGFIGLIFFYKFINAR